MYSDLKIVFIIYDKDIYTSKYHTGTLYSNTIQYRCGRNWNYARDYFFVKYNVYVITYPVLFCDRSFVFSVLPIVVVNGNCNLFATELDREKDVKCTTTLTHCTIRSDESELVIRCLCICPSTWLRLLLRKLLSTLVLITFIWFSHHAKNWWNINNETLYLNVHPPGSHATGM